MPTQNNILNLPFSKIVKKECWQEVLQSDELPDNETSLNVKKSFIKHDKSEL